jgi:hypothetical protein
MIQTVNLHDFRNAFQAAGRGEQFTYEGLEVLFDYLEQYEQATGEQIELDVIGLCCDYAESTYQEIAKDYDIDFSDCETEEDRRQAVIDYLNDSTTICGELDDEQTIIYQQF